MDYPIQPISVIEERGSADARERGVNAVNPYCEDSPHGSAWERGYQVGLDALWAEAAQLVRQRGAA
ncbi:MAG: hypothetical protein ACN6OP_04445 [Pseudomonadales bacterium]